MTKPVMPWELEEHVRVAFLEAVARHTVGVLVRRGTGLGTGVLVQFGADRFVGTAWHVMKDAPPEDTFFVARTSEPLRFGSKRELKTASRSGLRKAFRLPIDRIVTSSDAGDVALMHLSATPPELADMYFNDLASPRTSPLPGKIVLVLGFALELSRLAGPVRHTGDVAEYAAMIHAEWSEIVNPNEAPNYNPTLHFLADFRRDVPSEDFVNDPKGMSGSGVWLVPEFRKGEAWDPRDAKLVGIQSSWYAGRQMLKATRVERLIALLTG